MRCGILVASVVISICMVTFDGSFAIVNDYVDHKARLRHDLFASGRYDRYNSPLEIAWSASTRWSRGIRMRLVVLHVIKLEEAISSMTLNGWMLMSWLDPRLAWNESDYGFADALRVPDRSIWVPDIILYNNVDAFQADNSANMDLHIFSDGFVFWAVPVTFRSTCYAELKLYPFDEHNCVISLSSWTTGTHEMQLIPDYIDDHHEAEVLSHFFTKNPQWDLVEQSQDVKNITYSCCPGSHYQLYQIQLLLRRRSPFYKFMLVSPSVMSMILTLALFWIPPETPATKLSLGGTVIVVEVALLLFLGFQLPAGGESIPSIVLFCGNALVMTSLSLIVAIATHRISRTSGKKCVPDWLKTFLSGYGGKMLCLNGFESNIWVHFISKVHSFPTSRDKNDPQLIDSSEAQIELPEEQDGDSRNAEKSGNEWTEVAAAVDRMFFLFYCFVFIIIVLASFTQ